MKEKSVPTTVLPVHAFHLKCIYSKYEVIWITSLVKPSPLKSAQSATDKCLITQADIISLVNSLTSYRYHLP